MNIVFRTDASFDIGTGHVMRCLTLANALSKNGAECHFICRAHTNNLIAFIKEHGYQVHVLPSEESSSIKRNVNIKGDKNKLAHSHWLCASWQIDAEQTSIILKKIRPEWLIVDHYALDANWERAVKVHCEYLMIIDDLADRLHDCDLLLDQNLGRTSDDYYDLLKLDCKTLIGPKYALLRPEFSHLREYSLKQREAPHLKHILITMGGIDSQNVTGRILDILSTCLLPNDCRITVVMGLNAPWLDSVQKIASAMPWQTNVLMNVSNMAKLMSDSDFAIGAAGSTSWERCCLGLPSLMVILANNQVIVARALHDIHAAYLIGDLSEIDSEFDCGICDEITSITLMDELSKSAREVTDGCGVERVLNHMGIFS